MSEVEIYKKVGDYTNFYKKIRIIKSVRFRIVVSLFLFFWTLITNSPVTAMIGIFIAISIWIQIMARVFIYGVVYEEVYYKEEDNEENSLLIRLLGSSRCLIYKYYIKTKIGTSEITEEEYNKIKALQERELQRIKFEKELEENKKLEKEKEEATKREIEIEKIKEEVLEEYQKTFVDRGQVDFTKISTYSNIYDDEVKYFIINNGVKLEVDKEKYEEMNYLLDLYKQREEMEEEEEEENYTKNKEETQVL